MKTKTIAIVAAFVALGAAAAYPHIEAYRESLPQHLTKEEAGKRYLTLTCPVNKIRDQLVVVEKKMKDERGKTYYIGSDALDNANARMGALNNNRISLAHRIANARESASRSFADPKFIWPENVRNDIEKISDEFFSEAGKIRESLKGNKVEDSKDSGAADRIRRRLNLPVRGVCPAEYLK
jgi:hypothetical protein